MMNFFFTSEWFQALGGLGGIESALQSIAYAILAATFLMGVYEGFVAGGSLDRFGITVLKFGIAGAVIANWSAFFNDVVNTGTYIASTILGGNADIIKQWATDLGTQLSASSLSSLLSNGISALSMSLVFLAVIIVATVIFFACIKLFALIFIFWGGVLFCMGPLMIALSPSGLVGNYAGHYCRSLAEWALWPAMYAMFVTLMVAINAGSVSAIMTANPGLGADNATWNVLQLAVISLLYGLCVLLVPFIAHFIIKGQFAGVGKGLTRMARMAAGLATGGAGVAAGAVGGGSSMMPASVAGGGGMGTMASSGGGSVTGSNFGPSLPPPSSTVDAGSRMLSSSSTASQGSSFTSSSSTSGGGGTSAPPSSPGAGGGSTSFTASEGSSVTATSSTTNSGSGSGPRTIDGGALRYASSSSMVGGGGSFSISSPSSGGSGAGPSSTGGSGAGPSSSAPAGSGSSTASMGGGYLSSSSTFTGGSGFSSTSSTTGGGMGSIPPPPSNDSDDPSSGNAPPRSE